MDANGDSGNTSNSVVGGVITLRVRCPNGPIFSVQTRLGSTTVREFKVIVAQNSDVATYQQRLIFNGQILNNNRTLESYGLQADHTVHMVRRFPAVSTNIGDSDARREMYEYMLRRSVCLAGLGIGLDQILRMIQNRQVQLEMNQAQLEDDQNLRQHFQLEWERRQRVIEIELRFISGVRQYVECRRRVEEFIYGPHRGNISDSRPSSNAPGRD